MTRCNPVRQRPVEQPRCWHVASICPQRHRCCGLGHGGTSTSVGDERRELDLSLIALCQRLVHHYVFSICFLLNGGMTCVVAQLATWSEDLNQYVLDEDDESYEFSVRLVAQHVLREVSRMFGSRGQVAIGVASQSLMAQGATLRAAGSPHWWKCREAGLLGLGILVEDVENEDYRADLPAGKRSLIQSLS